MELWRSNETVLLTFRIPQVLGGGPVPRLALGAGGAPMRTPRETQRSGVTDPFLSARSGGQTARSAFAASAYSFRSMGVRFPHPTLDRGNHAHPGSCGASEHLVAAQLCAPMSSECGFTRCHCARC